MLDNLLLELSISAHTHLHTYAPEEHVRSILARARHSVFNLARARHSVFNLARARHSVFKVIHTHTQTHTYARTLVFKAVHKRTHTYGPEERVHSVLAHTRQPNLKLSISTRTPTHPNLQSCP